MKMLELERTFLVKQLPSDLATYQPIEVLDVYFPASAEHPILRLRKQGNAYELTKKLPASVDPSELHEHTIILSAEEYTVFATLPGKPVRKLRYRYPVGQWLAEIAVFQDALKGLVMVDFEFSSVAAKRRFKPPAFCGADVTNEEALAGGRLAGKSFQDIAPVLAKYAQP